jgi:hypothetical protein
MYINHATNWKARSLIITLAFFGVPRSYIYDRSIDPSISKASKTTLARATQIHRKRASNAENQIKNAFADFYRWGWKFQMPCTPHHVHARIH